MDIFKKFKTLTVNEAINLSRTDKNAVLIDVRSKEDYKKGHVSGSINVPMSNMNLIKGRVPSTEKTLYVIGSYDNKPKQAVKEFKKMGYKNAIPGGNMEDHQGILKRS